MKGVPASGLVGGRGGARLRQGYGGSTIARNEVTA